jgi:GNAT superfamily N-acetyltransferase
MSMIRRAGAADAAAIGLLGTAETVVLVGGSGPDGLAVLRFRPGIWGEGLECHRAELYVTPGQRGHGLGRALMEAGRSARPGGSARIIWILAPAKTTSPPAPSTKACDG